MKRETAISVNTCARLPIRTRTRPVSSAWHFFNEAPEVRSCEHPKSRAHSIKRACSASLDAFSDEEFSKKIQELALRFQLSNDDDDYSSSEVDSGSEVVSDSRDNHGVSRAESYNSVTEESSSLQKQRQFPLDSVEPPWPEIQQEPPDWSGRDYTIPASIERKANKVDLPLSLRMIKRKMQWQEGFRDAGESAYCSVKKAFSSMVFIIRELHSYALHMRELLFTEDLQGIIVRVQKEMHASFVWLFQQVFSHTPTLMVYVMILLANFTVYSMGCNTAIAASPSLGSYAAPNESVSIVEIQDQKNQKFDSSSVKTFSIFSSSSKSTSLGVTMAVVARSGQLPAELMAMDGSTIRTNLEQSFLMVLRI
ncbi:hypothetical protein GH714_035136 [Hevea brasiliensis]|uniref:Uncharacterized protein n=1 Tax=Hevea brasiliensis TaxID=3981 RepID=A0A6A6MFW7_HEVBR|nr:hypothetical protein GH714_035136 [Hevea brasiliensis]